MKPQASNTSSTSTAVAAAEVATTATTATAAHTTTTATTTTTTAISGSLKISASSSKASSKVNSPSLVAAAAAAAAARVESPTTPPRNTTVRHQSQYLAASPRALAEAAAVAAPPAVPPVDPMKYQVHPLTLSMVEVPPEHSTFDDNFVAPVRALPRLPDATASPLDFTVPQLAPTGAAVQPTPMQLMFGFRDVVEAKDRPVPRVFHPLTLRNITLANRIGVSPMCTYSSQSGFATDWHLVHYGKFAMYGFGLVMIEATAVLPEGRITPYDMGLWCDDHVAPLARIARFVHTVGGKAGIQIGHAGRKASTLFPHTSPTGQYHTATDDYGGWVPIGPTTVPFDALLHRKPREITDDELEEVKAAFVKAAKRANRAGFDLLEIHAAHGYLISSFMSPLVNKRTDGYGGSFENRVRLLLEIVEAIRATDPRSAASDMDIADDCDCDCWPKGKPLFVRLSGTEWVDDGGWSVEDTKRLAPLLYAAGADLIDVSSGGINPTQQINPFPLYQTPMSAGIKATVPNSVTATVGLITEPRQAEMILQRDCADVVFIGRQALREPEWPLRAARELGAVVEYPTQYSLVSRRR